MDLYTCKRCKRITKGLIRGICNECYDELEGKFVAVKDYIYDHPKALLSEISEEFNIPSKYIEGWIREGRITIAKDNEGLMVYCQQCGKPITSGKMCGACISKLGHQLRELKESEGIKKPKDTRASFRNTKY